MMNNKPKTRITEQDNMDKLQEMYYLLVADLSVMKNQLTTLIDSFGELKGDVEENQKKSDAQGDEIKRMLTISGFFLKIIVPAIFSGGGLWVIIREFAKNHLAS